MSREFTDWIKTLDELEPKGVQQEPRVYLAPPLRAGSALLPLALLLGGDSDCGVIRL